MGMLGKFIWCMLLGNALSLTAIAQLDSASLVKSIPETEGLIGSDYPQAMARGTAIYNQTIASCGWCRARAELMFGRMYWSDGDYPNGLVHFKRSANLAMAITDFDLWATAIDLIATTFYYQAYYDSAKYYYQRSYTQYESLGNIAGMVKVLNNFSLMYHRQGNFQKSIEYLFKCEQLRKDHPEVKYEIEALGAMGTLMVDTLYYNEQIKENLKELSSPEITRNDKKLASVYHNLGKAHRQLENYQTAARYFVKASRVQERLGLIPVWAQAGIDYRDGNMMDSSLFYLKRARQLANRTPRPYTAYHLELTGDTFKYFKQFDSALVYYKQAFDLGVKMNNRITFTGIHRSLVDVYTGLKKYNEAEHHLKTGLHLASEVALIHKRNLYGSGKKLYQAKGDYAMALEYATRSSAITDSLNRQQTAINLTRMQAEYQTAKKERELDLVKNKNIENELNIRNRNVVIASLAGASIISLGFILVFARQRNKIKKKNSALDVAYKEQLTLLQEVHHRVKNNLQLIASLINLQSSHSNNPEVVRELEKTRSRIMSIALIHQKLYRQDHMGPVDLKSFLTDLIANILSSADLEGGLNRNINIAQVDVGIDSALSIGLIVNELVTNALKHGLMKTNDPVLTVQVDHRKDQLVIFVKDNGPGNVNNPHTVGEGGFGLHLVDVLLKRLDGKMIFFDNGSSTKIEIGKF